MNPVSNIEKTQQKVQLTYKDLFISAFLLLIVVGLFFSDSLIDLANNSNGQLEESRKISKSMADLSVEIDRINIDTSILNNQFLRSVSPLPAYPLDTNSLNFGKANPFTGSNIVVATTTEVYGGARYSSQTSTSTGVIATTTPITNNSIRR